MTGRRRQGWQSLVMFLLFSACGVTQQQDPNPPPGNVPPPGTLDTTFGQQGVLPLDQATVQAGVVEAALSTDGSVILLYPVGGDIGVARVRPGAATQATTVDAGGEESPVAVAVGTDGKIIVAGMSDSRFVAARLGANLALDPTFGTQGMVTWPDPAHAEPGGQELRAMAFQPDGKVILAGTSGPGTDSADILLVRLTAAGQTDGTFGTSGVVRTSLEVLQPSPGASSSRDEAFTVAVQANGRILVGGRYRNAFDTAGVLLRYLPDGQLDATFGTAGTVRGTSQGRVYLLRVAADGSIYANNEVEKYTSYLGLSIGKYDTTGAPQGSTGHFAWRESAVPPTLLNDFRVSGGQLVAGGVTVAEQSVDAPLGGIARFGSDLKLDASFGTAGTGKVYVQAGDDVRRVLIQPDGKIVTVGFKSVQRYWP